MIIRNLEDVKKMGRVVSPKNKAFVSSRFLLEKDKMGFTITRTFIKKGDAQRWHYKKHLEACYCISGHGRLLDVKTNSMYIIKPDTMYALDRHDEHTFKAIENTILICVFNPPLKGKEIHKKDGSYKG